ncbi:MAG: SAM-dependent methyltransferase [Clostridia bacterium]|nr:SAM-dependent methyltransferase [Clostridia bacterium]
MNIDTKITPRLKMVADLVPCCNLVADIGTDHGYLPIYLVNKGICERAIAADINEGPLSSARKNIALTRVKDKIETVLSDGLKNIEKADCVTIAGMGGELIASILEHRKEGMTHFVLQPQRSYDVLRYFLAENGFEIKKEAIAKENDKMYCAFYAEYTGKNYEITENEALLGKSGLFEDDTLYKEYAEYRRKEIEKAIAQIEKAGAKGERYEELKRLLEIFSLSV